jgi:hypothetical protein
VPTAAVSTSASYRLRRVGTKKNCPKTFTFDKTLRKVVSPRKKFVFFLKKLPPYTLAGFELTTHSSSLLSGRRRRYHWTMPQDYFFSWMS